MFEREQGPLNADSNIPELVYKFRDNIKNGLKLTSRGQEMLINNHADKLIDLLEKEVQELVQWRVNHDHSLYTREQVDAFLYDQGVDADIEHYVD